MIRLAHVCSSDLAIPALAPFWRPLLERGWEVTFITPDGPHVVPGKEAGLRWLPLALQRRIHVASDIAGTVQLARYFLRDRYDIVHTHNIKAGHIGRVVAALARVPIVVHTIHGMAYSMQTPPLKRTAHAILEKIACLGCDMVLSQSREDRDTCIRTRVIDPDRVVVIGNGIDLSRFDPAKSAARRDEMRRSLGIAPDEIVFFSAGRLIVEKGFLELFEAAARARGRDPRIRLVVAGDLDERADTLDTATLERAREQGVLLLGRRSDMPDLYTASDVVVLASWHEGMPRVLIEGAAMGKPLLATDVPGCREIVEPPHNGRLVPVRDADALARGMLELAADAEGRQRMGDYNLAEARSRYAIENAVAIVNDVYERLLAGTVASQERA
jgi:glycosyltransferase involved in cell wall biosynthesis